MDQRIMGEASLLSSRQIERVLGQQIRLDLLQNALIIWFTHLRVTRANGPSARKFGSPKHDLWEEAKNREINLTFLQIWKTNWTNFHSFIWIFYLWTHEISHWKNRWRERTIYINHLVAPLIAWYQEGQVYNWER